MATEMNRGQDGIDLEVLTRVMSDFRKLPPDEREILLQLIATNFKIGGRIRTAISSEPEPILEDGEVGTTTGRYSEDRSMSPKEFMMEKQPLTDVERVACIAYYLTHYRDIPHFKTLDISKLNTEAAQPKFSNAANAVDNATKLGYLVPATKGNKQLSAAGEQFIQALPDRDAAKDVMTKLRQRRKARKSYVKIAKRVASLNE